MSEEPQEPETWPEDSPTGGERGHEPPSSERHPRDLDDRGDREELRQRYYGLLQELRVLLPGVQVLVAFLLTVPFAGRFEELDDLGRLLFGTALCGGLLAVVSFIGPTAFHRFGERTARGQRLVWGVRATVAGLGFLAVSLVAALAVVARFVYGGTAALVLPTVLAIAIVGSWVVLPRVVTGVTRGGSAPRDRAP